MKKLILAFALIALFLGAKAQSNDFITLRTGKIFECKITSIDTTNKTLTCSNLEGESIGIVPFSKIIRYNIDGVNYPISDDNVSLAFDSRILTNKYKTGGDLIKFANQAQTGIGLMLVGTLISTSAFLINTNKDTQEEVDKAQSNQNIMIYTGLAVSTVGFIVHLASFKNARNAGKLMQLSDEVSLNVTDYGVGLVKNF
jgi:hypothetical protein